MSYIPDCREDEYYNEKYLNEADKEFIDGYDWAVEMAMDNFFDNNFLKGLDDDTYIGHTMTKELPDSMKDRYTVDYKYGDRGTVEVETETIADYIRAMLMDYVERCRDEMITSMIDGMDDKEHERIKAKVDEAERG